MQECVGVPPVLTELGAQGGFVFLLAVPKKIVECFGIPNDSFVQRCETDRHGALPGGGCGPSAISVSSPRGRLRADFVLHDLGRLRRQGQEGEEVDPADRIRTQPPFETPQRVLVLKQGDHDAFRRGILALREPGVSATGCRLDCRRMSPENIESFGLLALLETETGEPEEHVRRTAAASQRPCGNRFKSPSRRRRRTGCPRGPRGPRSLRPAPAAGSGYRRGQATVRLPLPGRPCTGRDAIGPARAASHRTRGWARFPPGPSRLRAGPREWAPGRARSEAPPARKSSFDRSRRHRSRSTRFVPCRSPCFRRPESRAINFPSVPRPGNHVLAGRVSGDSGTEPRDRQLYARPSAWRGQCSAGRTSARSLRSARTAAPTRSSSSSTPTETIRSSITSARSATSAATTVCPTGT